MTTKHINSAVEFDALVRNTTYVLVDFYADWCPPCRMIAPVFQQLAQSHSVEGKLAFAKVNVDHIGELAMRYGITAMPTFIMLKNGRPANTIRGANPPALRAMLKTAEADLVSITKEEKKKNLEDKRKDSNPVSGGYIMSQGARSDWKMDLAG